MAKLNFGGVEENVVTREEFPLSKAQEVLKNETVAVIGYGVQGPGQALNQKDNGINVIVGQRKNSINLFPYVLCLGSNKRATCIVIVDAPEVLLPEVILLYRALTMDAGFTPGCL